MVVCSPHRVSRTGKADQHRLLSNTMTSLPVGPTGIDGMAMIEASANGVAFSDLIAHFAGGFVE
jgi:hypothetical protein